MESMQSLMNCQNCQSPYNLKDRKPGLLKCGHSICEKCYIQNPIKD